MMSDYDFSRPPRQRQRRRETGFYRALAGATALAVLAVMMLAWFIERDSTRLQVATQTLQAEVQQLQPRLAQVAALEALIDRQHQQLALHVVQATQRAFAPQALHALGAISPAHIRLQQIALRAGQAEIRGSASDQRQLQELADSLNASGLGPARLKELRQEPRHADQHDPLGMPVLRYRFTMTLGGDANGAPPPPQVSPQVSPQVPAQVPSPPADSEAAPLQRARRT